MATAENSERWLPIVGMEGLYEVSSIGRVRGLDRIARNGRRVKGVPIQGFIGPNGYRSMILAANGRKRTTTTHRLVLLAFCGPCPVGGDACHGNGIKTDNRIENLRWGTRSENILDNVHRGTHPSTRKTHCPKGHALVEGNLRAAVSARGYRGCLTCERSAAHEQWILLRAAAVALGIPFSRYRRDYGQSRRLAAAIIADPKLASVLPRRG